MVRVSDKYKAYLCVLFVAVILAPTIYYSTPAHIYSPDVAYVKGKILSVMGGDIYGDPVTGIPTMHPPIYHMILSIPIMLGVGVDRVLTLVTILNVSLIFFFIYKTIKKLFDSDVAVGVCLGLPFIFEYMGCGYLFLPTAIFFSLSLYLAGIYIYLTKRLTTNNVVAYSVLWGLAFLVNPIYAILIGLTILYELIVKREVRNFVVSSIVMGLMILPFLYQIYAVGVVGASPISFWADGDIVNLFSPTGHTWVEASTWLIPLVILVGVLGFRVGSTPKGYICILAISYLLTYFVFTPAYAARIYLFLSIFMVALALRYVINFNKLVYVASVTLLLGLGINGLILPSLDNYKNQSITKDRFNPNIDIISGLIPDGSFVLSSAITYRMYLLPHKRVRGFVAYKSGEYYQVPKVLSDGYAADFNQIMNDTCSVNRICDKYGIEYSLISMFDERTGGLAYVANKWEVIYSGRGIAIFKKESI